VGSHPLLSLLLPLFIRCNYVLILACCGRDSVSRCTFPSSGCNRCEVAENKTQVLENQVYKCVYLHEKYVSIG